MIDEIKEVFETDENVKKIKFCEKIKHLGQICRNTKTQSQKSNVNAVGAFSVFTMIVRLH